MGSCMSGNHGRRSFVTFVDRLLCVDLRALQRDDWLRAGGSASGMCKIPQPTGHLLEAYAECQLEDRIGALRVRFNIMPDLVTHLASTSQPLGGVRWWLVCPQCHAHRGKLFFGGVGVWGCRCCLQLRYRSQHLRPAARAKARCEWYFERMESFRWIAEPQRPHRMHRTTFERLLAHGVYYRQRWRELGILPHEKELSALIEKVRRRNARYMRRYVST
jgi:hypothetical protein